MPEPRKRRRWASYSLRSLFVLVTLAALATVWIGGAMRQERVVAAVRKIPGRLAYDFEVAERGSGSRPASWVPQRILDRVGKDYFHNVVEVDVGRSLNRLQIHEDVTDDTARMLTGLPHLEKLALLADDVSDVGLAELGKLQHLKSLSLDVGPRSHVTAGGLTFLAGLRRLERLSLDLRYLQITDEWMSALEPLHNLERLELDESSVTATGLAHLADLPNLKTLSLVNPACGDDAIVHVARLAGLERLRLFGAMLTDAGLAKLAALSNLKDLRLGFTSVTDAAVPDLLRLRNLEMLDVQGTRMTAAGLAQLADLPRLKQLNVSVARRDLPKLRAALPGCEVVNMH